jgi:hypothetical protein
VYSPTASWYLPAFMYPRPRFSRAPRTSPLSGGRTPPKLPNGQAFPAEPYHAAEYAFSLPPVTGILASRELDVEAAQSTFGQTYVRVDSQVSWQPVRPASTIISSGVRAVIVTAVAGLNDRTKPPAPVTITDTARVRELVALVNAQPPFPPGVFNCPADDGSSATCRPSRGGREPGRIDAEPMRPGAVRLC